MEYYYHQSRHSLRAQTDSHLSQILLIRLSQTFHEIDDFDFGYSKLSSLHQTLKTFTIRCDEARDRLHSAENLLHKSDAATNTEQPVEITIGKMTYCLQCKLVNI